MTKEKRTHLDEEAVLLLNKGRRGFFRLIFGRTTVVVLLLAAQFGLLFAGFYWLRDYTVYGGSMLAGLIVALIVAEPAPDPSIQSNPVLSPKLLALLHISAPHRQGEKSAILLFL